MENLERILRKVSYDLINGPIRNHQPLQLWHKRDFDRVEIYQDHINSAFSGNVQIKKNDSAALVVNSSHTKEYEVDIGLSVADKIVKSFGMNAPELSTKINRGRAIFISYDKSVCSEFMPADVEAFLASAGFVNTSPSFMKSLNKNDIFIITGVLSAKNLKVKIETELAANGKVQAELEGAASAGLKFDFSQNKLITMDAEVNTPVPIAVKAHRLQYHKDKFVGMKLVTDNLRGFF